MEIQLPDGMIVIGNDGPTITQTNYWESAYARNGEFFLSTNAGTVRLLVPSQWVRHVIDMATAKQIALTHGTHDGRDDCVEILFDDETATPFSILIGPHQYDRIWPDSACGSEVRFVVYRALGDTPIVAMAGLRREKRLPCLLPWGAPDPKRPA